MTTLQRRASANTSENVMVSRLKKLLPDLVPPLVAIAIFLLIYLNTRSIAKTVIILLAVPFSAVGAIWFLYALGYNMSVAVWVGLIALMGVDAETGMFMLLYLDLAFLEARKKGLMRNWNDLKEAILHGAVKRLRPKVMTVGVMFMGLVPIMWSTGSGADVMKRIAAPMVGGLATSAFLTLEIIPVVYTYWRYEQLLHERLTELDPGRRRKLRAFAGTVAAGALIVAAAMLSMLYVELSWTALAAVVASASVVACAAAAAYLLERRAGKRMVWG